MRMRAVPVEGHEAEGGVDVGVEDLEGEPVLLGDAGPVGYAGAAEWIDRQLEGGAGEGVEVDDVAEVVDVGGDVVVAVGGVGGEGFANARRLMPCSLFGDEFVRAVLDPLGGGRVGGAAVGRVVLEAAVFGWVVRGRDDDAVGGSFCAGGVVLEDGVREDGRGRVAELS